MKKFNYKIIVFVFLTICFLGGVGYESGKIKTYNARCNNYEIKSETNMGRIAGERQVLQSFVTDQDFYGVSVKVGTYSSQQKGKLHVVITDMDHGQIVLDSTYNTSKMGDNRYAFLATEQCIEVNQSTQFQIAITAEMFASSEGITIWESETDQYMNGECVVDGVRQQGDLVFGLVSEYNELMNWGMFIKRVMLMFLLYAFLSVHCFIEIKVLYERIYEYRVAIAVLLFVFMVANKFHFSSVNMYDSYIQPGDGSQYVDTVFGESRAIRSDEWLVNLPRFMAADYEDYGATNNIVRATETTGMSATGLYKGYSALARPADWGFYLLGSEYGVSFAWCFKIIFGFLFAFELCGIITRGNRKLALLGGILIEFSGFNMWWSTVDWLLAGNASIVFFYYFVKEKKLWKQLLYGIGTAIFASFYIINLYPAWQVPAGFIYLALLIWIIVTNRECWKQYHWKNWSIFAGCIIFMFSIIALYMYHYMDYMQAIMNTVYPGSRVVYGGFSISKLTGYFMSVLTSFVAHSNPSELSCFFGVFPFASIIFIILLVKKKGKSLLMWLILVPTLILTAYCTMELPPLLAKLMLMTYSTPKRAVDVLGFANVLMFMIAVSEQDDKYKLSLPVGGLIAVGSTALAVYYPITTEILGRKRIAQILILAFITVAAQIALICKINKNTKFAAAGLMGGIVLISGIMVNPVMCGLDAITSKPAAKKIQSIVEDDPQAKWIGLDSLINGNYLIACGARTYNSTNYIPNMEFWKILDPDRENDEVYNRYAHIVISLTENKTEMKLLQEDCVQLSLSYEDLKALDVKYIMSTNGNENMNYLEKMYDEDGVFIYRVQ